MLSKSFCLAVVAALGNSVGATDYYVATTGNDDGPGTLADPLKTIQRAADVMESGDTCYIRGGLYRETVTPLKSGTSGAPVTFTAYADEVVTISGCDPVEGGWSADKGSVFKVSASLDLGHENQVFADGDRMVWEARWPNVGTSSLEGLLEYEMATMGAGTTSTIIKNTEIPDYDWSGGSVWTSSYKRWLSWTGKVTGSGHGEISFVNNADPAGNMIAKEGGKFYVYGVRDALDSPNEWFYDESSAELFLWAPNGSQPVGVEIKSRLYGFDLSDRENVRLENLNFFATGIQISENSQGIVLDGIVMKHLYHSNKADKRYSSQRRTGLVLRGKNHQLLDSEIAYSSGTGVHLEGAGHRVINNYIHDHNYIGTYASPLEIDGADLVISHNTITRAGRQPIYLGKMPRGLLQYNDISYAGYLTWDLGLIYGNGIAGGNCEVRYNWFHDNLSPEHGYGIYYDHGCKNIITHHNVVWGITGAALKNNHHANYLLWYNNTATTGITSAWSAGMDNDLHGSRFVNNVLGGVARITAREDTYTLENNFYEYDQTVQHRYLKAGTDPVDAGVVLPSIAGEQIGDGHDAGAYELGGYEWRAGHDFENPPTTVDVERRLPVHRNRLVNASFEDGILSPWEVIGKHRVTVKAQKTSQWDKTAITLVGDYSAEFGKGLTGLTQLVTGLDPNTEYEFMGKFRVDEGESAFLGVKNYGGDELTGEVVENTDELWVKRTLRFTTGPNQTSAEVFAKKSSRGRGLVHFEDAGVQLKDR